MLALTVDIGSTFTKAIVLDISQETIVARSTEPSTVERDVSVGLERALEKMDSWGSLKGRLELRLGCSSAAGGLKIAAVGLVPELTGEAARRAALGAGGKVIGVYSHRLNKDDV
ncbi:MAG TPA: glutamate mutase L, partial [Candidatus Bathyarchaeia archaeon]